MPRKSSEQETEGDAVKIRITATEEHAAQAAADLRDALDSSSERYAVRGVSSFYRNRRDPNVGRIYLDVELRGPLGGEPR